MILVEPSSENLLDYSEDFSTFTATNTTVTVNDTESPDGNITASKITASSGTVRKLISRYVAATNTTEYTVSFYAKAGSHQFVQTYVANNGSIYANFDLESGQTQAFGGTTSNMTLAANGFYRCEFTFTGASTLAAGYIIFADSLTHARAGDSSADGYYYIWGAQVEAGSVATSYIPTSGSTVTRAADDLVISGSDFDFYNQSEGTFYVESNTRLSDGVPFVVEADNGTNNRIALYYESNEVRGFLKAGGVVTANPIFGNRPTAGNLSRTALSYKTNDFEGSVDGGSVIVDTSATIPTTINRFHLGSRFGQSDTHKLNGHLKRLIYWPYHSDSL
jgi:hypothetical protein